MAAEAMHWSEFIDAASSRFSDETTADLLKLAESAWRLEGRLQTPARPCSRPPEPPGGSRPLIVCLCGSTRFGAAFREANLRETLAGNIVLSIGCDLHSDADLFARVPAAEIERLKQRLDWLHRRKIDLADEVLILNVGGYVGDSTCSELEYARERGKGLRFLEPWPFRERWQHNSAVICPGVRGSPANKVPCGTFAISNAVCTIYNYVCNLPARLLY